MNIDTTAILFATATVTVAGVIRGFGGFGFSMIATVCLSLLFAPAKIVPVVLMLEVMASLMLIFKVWKEIDWATLFRLLPGVAVGTPAGSFLLFILDPRFMRIGIAVTVIVLAIILLRGYQMKRNPGAVGSFTIGSVSGILNGSAAIGGPPVILFFFSSPAQASVSRASLIAFFLITDIVGAGSAAAMGLVDSTTVISALCLVIPLGVGVSTGSRLFRRLPSDAVKKAVPVILIVLSFMALIRAAYL